MNMGAGPYAVTVSGGLERVGRDTSDQVVVRRRYNATGPVTFTLATASGGVTAGRVISAVAIVALLAALLLAIGRRIRRRDGRSSMPGRSPIEQPDESPPRVRAG